MRGPGQIRTALIASALLLAQVASGQPGAARPHVIAGTVRDAAGTAIVTATVFARSIGADSARPPVAALSDSAGHYAFRWTESAVLVTTTRIGYIASAQLLRLGATDGDTVRHDITLSALSSVPATNLPGVTTTARRRPNESRPTTAGESRSGAFAYGLDSRPITPGDLTEIAARAPGTIRTAASGDGATGISIAGQSPEQNHTSIDGASSQNASLPPEAVASASVILNAYDVSIGQFTGGELRATTRAGTNLWGAALRAGATPGGLAYGGSALTARRDAATTVRVDGGGGGPLIFDRLFGYAAVSLAQRTMPARFLDNGGAALLGGGAGIDSTLRRFSDILHQLGVPFATLISPTTTTETLSGVARFDLSAGEHDLFTIRLDGRSTRAGNGGATPTALSAGALSIRSTGAGILASWSSRHTAFRHELKLSVSRADRWVTSAANGPQVTVNALIPGSDVGAAALRLGGNLFGFDQQRQPFAEFSDELSWISPHGTNEWKFGIVANDDRSMIERRTPARGSITYASLDDLSSGRPSMYARASAATLDASVRYVALYLGDTWSPSAEWQVTFGVRPERSDYGISSRTPAGLARPGDSRTPPREFAWLPRLGASYFASNGKLSADAGVGLFRGRIRASTLSSAGGDAMGRSRIECVGSAIPRIDLADLYRHSDDAPQACVPGIPGFVSDQPYTTVFASDFGAPRALRSSLNVAWQLRNAFFLRLRALYALGYRESSAVDLNFDPRPRFVLTEEGGRPVFVDPSNINSVDGGIASSNSHLDPAIGSTIALGSRGRSHTTQLSAGLESYTPWGGAATMWYTYTSVRDVTNGFAALEGSTTNTAGDPRADNWGARDFTATHIVQVESSQRIARGVTLNVIARLSSGVPFTPTVAGDINGDGLDNDRAFVFDPKHTADPQVAAAMSQLLTASAPEVRECLVAQLGRVARRASCRTPWSPTLDAQLNFGPLVIGHRTVTVMLTAQNVTSGLDYALHGAAHLQGWGQLPFADDRLLQRVGFDAAQSRFRYQVNPSFGTTGSIRGSRAPFTISLQVRIATADPARQFLDNLVAAASAGRVSAAELQRFLQNRFPNVAGRALLNSRAWSLALSASQLTVVAGVSDSIGGLLGAAVDSLQQRLGKRGPGTTTDAATLRALIARADTLTEAGRLQVRSALTASQWMQLPVALREPQAGGSVLPPQRITIPNP